MCTHIKYAMHDKAVTRKVCQPSRSLMCFQVFTCGYSWSLPLPPPPPLAFCLDKYPISGYVGAMSHAMYWDQVSC